MVERVFFLPAHTRYQSRPIDEDKTHPLDYADTCIEPVKFVKNFWNYDI